MAFAALCGALLALGQAPFELWPLALPALTGLMALHAAERGAGGAALRAWAAGCAYFAVALHWIVEPFFVDPQAHGWMAPFALVFMCGGLALFWGAAGWAARRIAPGPLAFALTLALAELARAHVLTGFPWALIGYVWIGTPVMQWAAWIGPHGLTLVTLLLAAAAAALLARGQAPRAAALLVLGAALIWGAGLARIAQGLPAASEQTVRLVQPNAPQREKWDPDRIPVFYSRQVGFTMARPRPDLVVWPETALPGLLEHADEPLAHIAEAAGGPPVVIGIQRSDATRRYFNSAVVVGPDGTAQDIYDKHHLVPFGEYMPLPGFWRNIGIHGLAARADSGYTPGPGPRLLDLGPIGPALPLICYEAVFPQDVGGAPARPRLLLQLTNDAWFGTFSGPWQHLAQARLRAVEQGLPLLRAANTGISAAVDAHGGVLAEIPLGEAGFVDVPLPAALPPTPYARTGDWPAALLLAFLLAAAFAHARTNRD
ncbi:MAG: apolipoprotein N-acyltransferase [Paracoccaceae bacterium]